MDLYVIFSWLRARVNTNTLTRTLTGLFLYDINEGELSIADINYEIKEDYEYDSEIRALKNTDKASATETFNPLNEKLINNIHAVKGLVEKHKESSDHDSRYYTQDQTDNKLEAAIAGKKAKRIARCYSNASSQPTYFKLAQARITTYNNLQGIFNVLYMSGSSARAAKIHWAMRANSDTSVTINSFKIISSTSTSFFTNNKDIFFLTYYFNDGVLVVDFWSYINTTYSGVVFEPDTSFFALPTNEQSITVFEHPDISTGQTEEPEGTRLYLECAEIFSKYPNGLIVTDTSWEPTRTALELNESCTIALSAQVMKAISGTERTAFGTLARLSATTYWLFLGNVNYDGTVREFIMRFDRYEGWTTIRETDLPKYPNGAQIANTAWKPTNLTIGANEQANIWLTADVLTQITNGRYTQTWSGTITRKSSVVWDLVGQMGDGSKILTGRYTSDPESWQWFSYAPKLTASAYTDTLTTGAYYRLADFKINSNNNIHGTLKVISTTTNGGAHADIDIALRASGGADRLVWSMLKITSVTDINSWNNNTFFINSYPDGSKVAVELWTYLSGQYVGTAIEALTDFYAISGQQFTNSDIITYNFYGGGGKAELPAGTKIYPTFTDYIK